MTELRLKFKNEKDKLAFLRWKLWCERELKKLPHLAKERSWTGLAAIAHAEVVEVDEKPVVQVTVCGGGCPMGGEHQWDGPWTGQEEGSSCQSVTCSKCTLAKIDYDLLTLEVP